MTWTAKDPADVADYCIDFSAFLPTGETISTFTLTATGVTVEFSNLDTTAKKVQARLAGGTVGSYPISCSIVTTAGETFSVTPTLNVALRKG